MREFDRAIDTILGTGQEHYRGQAHPAPARLRKMSAPDPCGLDSSVWYASHAQFTSLCRNVDERVIFAQFIDSVRRLQAFVDFRCHLQVSTTTLGLDRADPELQELAAAVDKHLAALDEDLRFCGVLLINDHGKPVHKRLMGIRFDAAS